MKKVKWMILVSCLGLFLFAGITAFSVENKETNVTTKPEDAPISSVQQEDVVLPETVAGHTEANPSTDSQVNKKPTAESSQTVSAEEKEPSSAAKPVSEDHKPAAAPQTVSNPVSGYCGNIQTTIHWNEKDYTFEGNDSVIVTDIVINLQYDPNKVCKCLPDIMVNTQDGGHYGLSLKEAYVRCEKGQADLTADQVKAIEAVLNRLAPKKAIAE